MNSEVMFCVIFACIVCGPMVVVRGSSDNLETAPDASAGGGNAPGGHGSVESTESPSKNTSCVNGTDCSKDKETAAFPSYDYFTQNKGMVMRSFYVLIGVTGIVIVYFIIRTVRLRRRRSKSKKYGVIATSGSDNLEMTPLDQDDDDEDLTVFEVNGRR